MYATVSPTTSHGNSLLPPSPFLGNAKVDSTDTIPLSSNACHTQHKLGLEQMLNINLWLLQLQGVEDLKQSFTCVTNPVKHQSGGFWQQSFHLRRCVNNIPFTRRMCCVHSLYCTGNSEFNFHNSIKMLSFTPSMSSEDVLKAHHVLFKQLFTLSKRAQQKQEGRLV